jgi:uncharacterized zinc-type alcohol dehydrogenase-like protein
MPPAVGYATNHSYSKLAPHKFERRDPGPSDVRIDVLYCGVCHSDIHQCANDWGNTIYPCLPGHEIVGRVSAVGSAVTKFNAGDAVGVGCMVDSCRRCQSCLKGLEQYCEGPKGMTLTYNGPAKPDGTNTFGGYSNSLVVAEDFVLRIPPNLDLKGVAPLLCAGITTYSPLRHWKVSPGQAVAVVGLGGLGHVAVKLAAALGADVTVISTSAEKKADALRFGAKSFVLSTDDAEMDKLELAFDFVLSTIPDAHDINPFVKLLKRDGTLTLVGALQPFAKPTDNSEVAFHRRCVAGSLIGGIAETQEVLDFCGAHGITADVEVIAMETINEAFKKVKNGTVRYRYVIDIANTLKTA